MTEQDHEGALAAFDRKLYERPYPTCGRMRIRRTGLCTLPAGWGTSHAGRGACKLHGGIKNRDTDRRLKHGLYSTVSDVRIQEIQEEIHAAGNPLDVTQELTLARALLVDWTERYALLRDAILEWNESRLPEDRPARVPDIAELFPALESISRIVYRIERATSDKYIPRGTFYRIMLAMGRVVDARVHDEAVREQIRQDWLKIEAV
jgi:hypothetical protein